jgi:hypothetical protein
MSAEEQLPLLGEWTTACKAFEVLPLVVGGSESPSLVNGFHAKGFVDIVKGRIQDPKPKVEEIRTQVGDAFLKVGGPGLYHAAELLARCFCFGVTSLFQMFFKRHTFQHLFGNNLVPGSVRGNNCLI